MPTEISKTNLQDESAAQQNASGMDQKGTNAVKADAPGVGELAADDPSVQQQENNFDIALEGVNYIVKVSPFVFNDETRYYVSVDEGPTNLFLWDTPMNQIRSLDDSAGALPTGLEKAISERLMRIDEKSG